jgi:hypothetical protein
MEGAGEQSVHLRFRGEVYTLLWMAYISVNVAKLKVGEEILKWL